MEKISIFTDNMWVQRYLHIIEKIPGYLCEHCGLILFMKASLKRHMAILHEEKVTLNECSKCHKKYNQLDNMRTHIRTHHDHQVTTHKTLFNTEQIVVNKCETGVKNVHADFVKLNTKS